MTVTLTTLLGLGVLLGTPSGPAVSSPPWKAVELEASKLGMKARSSIEVEPLSAAARSELIEVESHRETPAGPSGLLLTEETRFAGRDSQTRIWFDGRDGTSQQREVLETGKRERRKVNRFTDTGVFTLRVYPTREQSGQAPSSWTDRSETFYPFAELGRPDATRPVIEPGALIYLVAAGTLRRVGESEVFYAFSDKRILPVEARVVRNTWVGAEYDLVTHGKSHRIENPQHPALEIRLSPSGVDDDDMKILGLQGEVTLLVDPELRIPLEVSGRVKFLGRVTIRLQKAVVD